MLFGTDVGENERALQQNNFVSSLSLTIYKYKPLGKGVLRVLRHFFFTVSQK